MLCPYMVFTRYRRTLIKWFAWGMTSNNNVLKFQSKTELKFTKSSLKIIPVCTLGLVKYYVLNTIFFMIKDLVWSRVIIFHVFIIALITTAAANDDTMKITDNRHWTLSVYVALYMEYFTEEILMLTAILDRRYHSSRIFTNEEAETPCLRPHPSPTAD